MSWRYDMTGERIEVNDDDGLLYVHPVGCDNGWIEVDAEQVIVRACPACRPASGRRGRDAP